MQTRSLSLFVMENSIYLNSIKTEQDYFLTVLYPDKIANNPKELQKVLFGERFGGITDLEVGPDCYLYVVSIWK